MLTGLGASALYGCKQLPPHTQLALGPAQKPHGVGTQEGKGSDWLAWPQTSKQAQEKANGFFLTRTAAFQLLCRFVGNNEQPTFFGYGTARNPLRNTYAPKTEKWGWLRWLLTKGNRGQQVQYERTTKSAKMRAGTATLDKWWPSILPPIFWENWNERVRINWRIK